MANQVAAPVETKFIQVPEDEFLSLKKAVEAQTREIAKLKRRATTSYRRGVTGRAPATNRQTFERDVR